MSVVYLDSAYAGSQGAASGDLGFGAGNIWTRPDQYWPSAVSGDNVYFRSDRVWSPPAGVFFSSTGIAGKRLIISRYGGDASSELPLLDGSYYEDSSSGWAYIGGGVWQKTLVTGGSWGLSDFMFIDTARPTTDIASWVAGTMMRKANGNYASGYVNGNNPRSGNGIWWDFLSGANLVLQVWTGSAVNDPIATYGCLRGQWGKTGAGAATYAFNVINSGANDTEVHEVAAAFCRNSNFGSGGTQSTIDGVLFDSIRSLCSPRLFSLTSAVTDAFVQNIELSGDWYADDMIDPVNAVAASLDDDKDMNAWEGLALTNRCRDINISGGEMHNGGGHGALNFKADNAGDGTQARGQRVTLDGTRFVCDIRARNSRSASIGNWDDARVARAKFTGYSVRAQLAGTRTVINQAEWSALGGDLVSATDANPSVSIETEIEAGTLSVSILNSLVDNRGRVAQGATQANACIGMRAANSKPIASGACDVSNNQLLADTGQAGFWISNGNGGTANDQVNANQTCANNWWNTGVAAVECYTKNGTGTGLTGTTATTVAARLTGSTSGTVQKTVAQILSGGGNRPMTPRPTLSADRMPFG